ncbi:MAG: ABC transporter substrate-binding protein [Treponema sp.]|jgi:polar amino acid transport system substrate-binding protein|nr:ABC transporter substrate-binding protein [Treponema sp.]
MKRILTILLLTVVIITACSKEPSTLTIKNGILMVGMNIGYPPMEYMADDEITPAGFDVILGRAIAEKMGLEVQFVNTAWDKIFTAVDAKNFDCIISAVTITPERQESYNFSKPYIKNALVVIMPKNSRHIITSPLGLSGLGIAYKRATTSEQYMRQLRNEGLRFSSYEYESVINCFDELRAGRIDALMTDLLVAYEYLGNTDDYKIVWQGGEEVFSICLKKGNDVLTSAIDEALDELINDGTLLRLSKETFNGLDMISGARQ